MRVKFRNLESYILYSFLYEAAITNGNPCKYISCIRNLLNATGLSYIWRDQYVNPISSSWLKLSIGRILNDIALQTWSSDIENSSKAITYRILKTELILEPYLTYLPRSKAINLLHFRTSTHRLPIETGRWNNTPIHNRICHLCQLNDIGDEYHYVFKCPYFSNERKKYIPSYYLSRLSILNLGSLFSCKKISVLKNLSVFCTIVMNSLKRITS